VGRRIFVVLLFCVALGLAPVGGCGGSKPKFTEEQLATMPLAVRQGLPDASGGFVLAVGDETIEAEEVVGLIYERLLPLAQQSDFGRFEQLAAPAVKQVLIAKVSDALLYSKAKEEFGEDVEGQIDKAAAGEVRKFVASFGGDYAKAEQAIQRMGMDWGQFEQYQKRVILSQSYIAKQMPEQRPITYRQMISLYDDIKDEEFSMPGRFQYQLIDIQPAKVEVSDANQSRTEAAKDLAKELMRRIKTGADFGELAKQHSHGPRASAGGLSRELDPQSLASPYDVLAVEAANIKQGQVAGPIDAEGHIFIMKLAEWKSGGTVPFEQVQEQIKARIRVQRQREVIDEFNSRLLEQAEVAELEKFVDFCVRAIYESARS